jgi:hypothetical protein
LITVGGQDPRQVFAYGDFGHFLLDLVGFAPGFGEAAGGAHCAWYEAEGDAVSVNFNTGEVYVKPPDGQRSQDSIGNTFDFFPE